MEGSVKDSRYKLKRISPYYFYISYPLTMILLLWFVAFSISSLLKASDQAFAKVVLIIMYIGGAFSFSNFFLQIFSGSYEFIFEEKVLKYKNINKKWVIVPYNSIFNIKERRTESHTLMVKYYNSGKKVKTFNINTKTTNFGELVEIILERAENIEDLSIRKVLKLNEKMKDIWDKEPNLDIINRAERRAKENREKKQKENP